METIEITVLDYYNHPKYYPYMSEDLFDTLEQAFLDDKLTVSIPKKDLDSMIQEYNKDKPS